MLSNVTRSFNVKFRIYWFFKAERLWWRGVWGMKKQKNTITWARLSKLKAAALKNEALINKNTKIWLFSSLYYLILCNLSKLSVKYFSISRVFCTRGSASAVQHFRKVFLLIYYHAIQLFLSNTTKVNFLLVYPSFVPFFSSFLFLKNKSMNKVKTKNLTNHKKW